MGARNSLGGEIARLVTNNGKTLEGGGGPPHDPDMERRLTSLEQDVKAIQATLGDMRVTLERLATRDDIKSLEDKISIFRTEVNAMAVDVGTVKGRVSALPTLTALSVIATLLGAFGTFIVFINRLGINHHWW